MKIEPRILNNVCLSSHPQGVMRDTQRQIEFMKRQKSFAAKRVLVIGGSSGFGLASRLSALFSSKSSLISVGFDKEPSAKRAGTPGYYANLVTDDEAKKAHLKSYTINADAFADSTREQVADLLKRELAQIDLLVYSIASPVRKDPVTGELYHSVIKPIGSNYRTIGLDFVKRTLQEKEILAANESEVRATVKVMGGEDWQLWIDYLQNKNLLAPGFRTVAYSYIGPSYTHPIYKNGTIGRAKEHLWQTAINLDKQLNSVQGHAYLSVNKALVTRASAVIPAVSLYIALLYRVMKDLGIHEECAEQMHRLFADKLAAEEPILDSQGLIRVDDWEMRSDVQAEVAKRWENINQDNLAELADLEGYYQSYLRIHGFGIEGVDYEADVDPLSFPLSANI